MYHIAKKFKRASAFYVIMECTNLCTYTTNVCDHFQSEHFFALAVYFLFFSTTLIISVDQDEKTNTNTHEQVHVPTL